MPSVHPDYQSYWQAFLASHTQEETRLAHYFAVGIGVGGLAVSIAMLQPAWLCLGLLMAYMSAFVSHVVFEGRVLAATNPVWEARAALNMTGLALSGRLAVERARLAVSTSTD